MKTMRYITLFVVVVVVASCAAPKQSLMETEARQRMKSLDQETQDNINRLIDMIEERTRSYPKEERYIPYEFRIPLDSTKKEQLLRIDPLLQFTNRRDTYQCISDNATKEKVFQIVALPFTYKIKFCPYE